MTRMPVPERLGLGVGVDLRHGDPYGFVDDGAGGDRLAPRVQRFLEEHPFSHAFFSFQPRDRSRLRLEDYAPAWDALMDGLPDYAAVGLHHTLLNLGSLEREDRGALCDFTNALIDRYDLAWVNEDLGIWSIGGKLMPYPLPPLLTEPGLAKAIAEVRDVMARLDAPLVVEFPGFSEGTNFLMGDLDAYDYFRALADESGCLVTLDTGHLLSWRWLQGHRGDALLADLDRLPLERCFEVHLSGCSLIDGRFVDVHHGVLLPEQLALAEELMTRCPSLRAVTYEDPKPTPDGQVRGPAAPGFEQLVALVDRQWRADAA